MAQHHILTVHDCINVDYTYARDWRLPYFRNVFQCVLDNAELLVAISHSTRQAIFRNYRVPEAKVVVIQPGFDAFLPSAIVEECEAPRPYILMVTNELPHKNAAIACKGFAISRAAREEYELMIVGSLSEDALHVCTSARIRFSIVSEISDAELAKLYRGCTLFLSASLEEGFDLPVAEALSCDARVICSDIAAHREFYSTVAHFFSPADPESLAGMIDMVLADAKATSPRKSHVLSRTFRVVAEEYHRVFSGIAMQATRA